jgi:hypothetical protein
MTPDAYDVAAAAMAAALGAEPLEVQQAYRYLFARVALDAGILELIGHEIRESGERLVCREPATDALYAADRPQEWSHEEEESYVADLRRRLLGAD